MVFNSYIYIHIIKSLYIDLAEIIVFFYLHVNILVQLKLTGKRVLLKFVHGNAWLLWVYLFFLWWLMQSVLSGGLTVITAQLRLVTFLKRSVEGEIFKYLQSLRNIDPPKRLGLLGCCFGTKSLMLSTRWHHSKKWNGVDLSRCWHNSLIGNWNNNRNL